MFGDARYYALVLLLCTVSGVMKFIAVSCVSVIWYIL